MEGMTFKAKPKKTVSAAQDEKSESASTKKKEAALAKKPVKKVAKKKTLNKAAVALAKKSNVGGNPGAKAAAIKRVQKYGK